MQQAISQSRQDDGLYLTQANTAIVMLLLFIAVALAIYSITKMAAQRDWEPVTILQF